MKRFFMLLASAVILFSVYACPAPDPFFHARFKTVMGDGDLYFRVGTTADQYVIASGLVLEDTTTGFFSATPGVYDVFRSSAGVIFNNLPPQNNTFVAGKQYEIKMGGGANFTILLLN